MGTDEDLGEDSLSRFDGTNNWYFTDLDTIAFDDLLTTPHSEPLPCISLDDSVNNIMDVEASASSRPKELKTIEFIVMVGFHHKVGS